MSGNLTEEEYNALQEHGLVERVGSSKRKISSSYLTPPTSSAGSTSSSSSAGRVISASWASPPVTSPDLVYPASPVSVEALEFIGLDRATAQDLFDSLKSAQITERFKEEDEAYELTTFIRGHLLQLRTRLYDLPIEDAYTRVGLTADTIAAILDPKFREVFETETPFYWANDTLQLRFSHVVSVDERIKNSAEKAVLARKQKKRPKVEDLFGGNEAQSSQSSSSQASSGITRSGINTGSSHLPTNCVFAEPAPEPPADHLVLYTGKNPAEFNGTRGPRFIREDGTLNMMTISSDGGKDFNRVGPAWYFTTEPKTADLYRQFSASRVKCEETWIIRMAIPKQLARTLRTKELWWSHDFREFVWHCRMREKIPERHQHYDSCDVLIGHILKYPNIGNCKKHEIHSKITVDKLCTLDNGNKATQWVVKNEDTMDKIVEWSQGKVHIEVFAPMIQQENPTS